MAANVSDAYRFGSFGSARFPVQIWQFYNGQLTDVTRAYPDFVLADAASHDKEWKSDRNEYALASELADLLVAGQTLAAHKLIAEAPDSESANLRDWLVTQGYGDPALHTPTPSDSNPYDQVPVTQQVPAGLVPITKPTPQPVYVAPHSDDCESVDVTGVYDDGAIVELSDGRHLHVDDADAVTSSVWVAPFDALICDDGDKLINKDENESVDLKP